MPFISGTVSRLGDLEDRKIIADTLSLNRVWASEAFMTLDDNYWHLARWYGFQDGNQKAFLLKFPQIKPTPTLLLGAPNCMAHILRSDVMPPDIFVEAPVSSVGVLRTRYRFESSVIMVKMYLEHFRPTAFEINPMVRELGPDDFDDARDLYQNNVDRGQFDRDDFLKNIYYGVYQDGELVSMAGTTVICIDFRTANIGNVITDHNSRHRGYATSILVELCRNLVDQGISCLTIKTSRGNNQAISLYRRIGFSKHCEYFEGLGEEIPQK